MNTVIKKVIAAVTAAIIVIRILTFSAFSFVAAPAAYSIELFIEAVLTAMGVSQSEIEVLSYPEKEKMILDSLSYNGGSVSSSDLLYLLSGQAQLDKYKDFMDFYNSSVARVSVDVLNKMIRDWWRDNFVNLDSAGSVLVGKPSIDLMGNGAMAFIRNTSWGLVHVYYCDYIEVRGGYFYIYNQHAYILKVGDDIIYHERPGSSSSQVLEYYYLYGDVRFEDGTKAPSEEIEIAPPDEDTVIGVLPDGTEVTIGDVIGTDGTIDGVPVIPDWDIFDDSAIIELIKELIDALDREHSRVDSSDLADTVVDSVTETIGDSAIELEGLEGLLLPSSIVHVFPFCLPFDFVQGMYLFEA